jgi:hypothetical protein
MIVAVVVASPVVLVFVAVVLVVVAAPVAVVSAVVALVPVAVGVEVLVLYGSVQWHLSLREFGELVLLIKTMISHEYLRIPVNIIKKKKKNNNNDNK